MFKKNIPETIRSLVGDLIGFGENRQILPQINQLIQGAAGNRCGHHPKTPRFYDRPSHHHRRPSILEEGIECLKDAYRWPKRFLKKLTLLRADERQQRSERREALISVAQVLLHYVDLSTLRAGFYTTSHEFIALDLDFIAKKAGLTTIRAKRALSDLAKAEYVTIRRQVKKDATGQFRAFPSLRELTLSFFIDLGLDIQQLSFLRAWKRKKQEKALTSRRHKKLKGLFKALAAFGKKQPSLHQKAFRTPARAQQAFIHQALELHYRHPEYPPSAYLKTLRQQVFK